MNRPLLRPMIALMALLPAAGFGAEGTLVVANRAGGSVSLIDLPTSTEIARLPIGPVIPHEMAASPDGRWAVTGEYGTGSNPGRHLVVIDIAAAEIVSRIDLGPDSRPHSIAFLSDSRHVVTTMERSERIALVDIIAGEVIRSWPTGGQDSHMVRLSPDNSRAYVAARGGDGTLSAIWLNEDRAPEVVRTGRGAEGIAVAPDGTAIWVANRDDASISVVDAATLQVTASFEVPPTNRLEFLPDGQVAIPGGPGPDSAARDITFHDAPSAAAITRRVQLPASPAAGTGVRLLAAGDVLFLADSALDQIRILDYANGNSPVLLVTNTDNPDGMAWSPLRVRVMTQ